MLENFESGKLQNHKRSRFIDSKPGVLYNKNAIKRKNGGSYGYKETGYF